MKSSLSLRWALLLVVNVLGWCMLSLQQPGVAGPPAKESQPFANAVEQRFEMIKELKEINTQLKEQNALLRSGNLRVIVDAPKR